MKHTIFTGAATAIITPMTETGVDYDALGRLIDFQLEKALTRLLHREPPARGAPSLTGNMRR